ncbi:MAG: hypothetical protein II417_01580 [Elusimicrobia bacterium]|jgi:uncharacterized protein YoxC|nr:hypothetical protein [Methanobrevibacter sp.]MBQ2219469.1 hypothetical protein [Elusimicrobiota bacterium]
MKKAWVRIFSLQNIIALGTIFFGICFWVYTMNGIPKLVDNHEQRISKIEKELLETRTKTDMILNAVYEIRAVLLKQK